MKYMIAVPCMDTVATLFFASFLSMWRPDDTEVQISSSSLIYDSRNRLAQIAVEKGVDRVLWLDSDMTFPPDLMRRLIADMDEGRDIVSALYFTRKAPIKPCIFDVLETLEGGLTKVESFVSYPRDSVFEVAGAGMGAMMTSREALLGAGKDARPFSPMEGFGEDFSFEIRAREAGYPTYCDSRIKCGHIGQTVITEETWGGRKS